MSTLKITPSKWRRIKEQLHEEHPKSVFMLRNRMKQVLGFTVRNYREYPDEGKKSGQQYWGRPEEGVYLDFWNDAQETFFSMKYLNL